MVINFFTSLIAIALIYGLSSINRPPLKQLPLITTIDPKLTKYLAFGNRNFFSDLNWIEFLQEASQDPFNLNLKSPEYFLLKKSVTHDKRNCVVYHQGGSFLSVLKRDIYGAEDLIIQGTKNCHYSGRFYFLLGYHYMEEMGHLKKAAHAFLEASKFEDSPPHLAGLASRLYANTGNLFFSKNVVELMIRNTEKENTEHLKERLKLIDMEIIMRTLTEVSQKYIKDTGKIPKNLSELKERGYIKHIPDDPTGFTWKITKDGKVLSTNPNRYRRHEASIKDD
jgi:hypothetical protein